MVISIFAAVLFSILSGLAQPNIADNFNYDLRLYLSHKYISDILRKTEPQVSCLTPPGMTRDEYIHQMEMENLRFKNRLRALLESNSQNEAIAYFANSMEAISQAFRESLGKEAASGTIEVTETKELSVDLGRRSVIRQNNMAISSQYMSDFMNEKLDSVNTAQLLFYSDVIASNGYIYSVIPALLNEKYQD